MSENGELLNWFYRLDTDIEDITQPRGDTKFLFECWKIFFNTQKEILYLQAAM